MDYVIDFLYVGDGDAIIIWGRNPETSQDFVFFLDGGKSGDGQKVIEHYEKWIKPNLYEKRAIGFINSHPHADHINGLIEIIEKLGSELKFGIYNDPIECITDKHKDRIYKEYLQKKDPDISHLYETFKQIEKLNELCSKFNIKRCNAYSDDINLFNGSFKLLSPSKDFYVNLVQYFTDVDFLKTVDFSNRPVANVDESEENNKPSVIIDQVNDASPENLTSTVIQLLDRKGKKYILTGDAGVDSFDYMEDVFDESNILFVQLPHHGSRRNINTKWLNKFNPSYFIASAIGNDKHPRKAIINYVKRNITNCNVYSTHTSKGTLSVTTNKDVFPVRNWGSATPL